MDDEIRFTRLNPTIGAVVTQVDLRERLGTDTAEALRAALHRYKVLILPGQDLSERQYEEFGRIFGQLFIHPTMPALDGHPALNPVATEHGPARDWHVGGPWRRCPFPVEMLQLKTVPPAGGDTMWADLQAAYAGYSLAIKTLLSSLSAVYLADPRQYSPTSRVSQAPPAEVAHPLVIAHPGTGTPGLYYSTSATRFAGVNDAEQSAVRALVFSQATEPRYSLRHRWSSGDIAVWDNFAVWHRAVDDYGNADRLGWHIAITGDQELHAFSEATVTREVGMA